VRPASAAVVLRLVRPINSINCIPSVFRYKIDSSMYTTDTSKMTKAITDTIPRVTPFNLILANEIKKEANTISPIPMKEAHILSILLMKSPYI
jgi:hypothetical protein